MLDKRDKRKREKVENTSPDKGIARVKGEATMGGEANICMQAGEVAACILQEL